MIASYSLENLRSLLLDNIRFNSQAFLGRGGGRKDDADEVDKWLSLIDRLQKEYQKDHLVWQQSAKAGLLRWFFEFDGKQASWLAKVKVASYFNYAFPGLSVVWLHTMWAMIIGDDLQLSADDRAKILAGQAVVSFIWQDLRWDLEKPVIGELEDIAALSGSKLFIGRKLKGIANIQFLLAGKIYSGEEPYTPKTQNQMTWYRLAGDRLRLDSALAQNFRSSLLDCGGLIIGEQPAAVALQNTTSADEIFQKYQAQWAILSFTVNLSYLNLAFGQCLACLNSNEYAAELSENWHENQEGLKFYQLNKNRGLIFELWSETEALQGFLFNLAASYDRLGTDKKSTLAVDIYQLTSRAYALNRVPDLIHKCLILAGEYSFVALDILWELLFLSRWVNQSFGGGLAIEKILAEKLVLEVKPDFSDYFLAELYQDFDFTPQSDKLSFALNKTKESTASLVLIVDRIKRDLTTVPQLCNSLNHEILVKVLGQLLLSCSLVMIARQAEDKIRVSAKDSQSEHYSPEVDFEYYNQKIKLAEQFSTILLPDLELANNMLYILNSESDIYLTKPQ